MIHIPTALGALAVLAALLVGAAVFLCTLKNNHNKKLLLWLHSLQQQLIRLTRPKRARPKRRRKADALAEPDWWLELEEYHNALEEKASAGRKNFLCKISQEIMRHPALLADGHVSSFHYEHDLAKRWVDENSTEPTTRARMCNPRLTLSANSPL